MATVVTWKLNLQEVEIGKEVEFIAEGLDAFENMGVFITLPNGSSFVWGVVADANGRVRETIKLDSGLGQYHFCPKPTCGRVIPFCAPLNVCPCRKSSTDCDIKVTGPDRLMMRSKAIYVVSGLKPSSKITIKAASRDQVTSYVDRISDHNGELRFEFSWAVEGQYALTFADESCISHPFIVDIVSDTNWPIGLTKQQIDDCAAPVSISAYFNKASYKKNEVGSLKIAFRNTGSQARNLSIYKAFVFNDANITLDPIPLSLDIPGYSTMEYVVFFTAGASDKIISGSIGAAYTCGDLNFTANGSEFSAIVGAGEGYCSAILQYFAAENPQNSYEPDEEIDLVLTVLNTGSVPISQAVVNQFNIPADTAIITLIPITFGPINAGASASVNIKIKFTAEGSYTIQLPAGSVQYKCQAAGQFVPVTQPGYISFNIVQGG